MVDSGLGSEPAVSHNVAVDFLIVCMRVCVECQEQPIEETEVNCSSTGFAWVSPLPVQFNRCNSTGAIQPVQFNRFNSTGAILAVYVEMNGGHAWVPTKLKKEECASRARACVSEREI
jgi:hypothetical protein